MLYFENKRTNDTVSTESIAFGQLRIQTVLDKGFFEPRMTRDQNPHCHLNHEIYFVESGCFRVLCKDTEYTVEEGEVLFINAGTEHCVKKLSEGATLSSLRTSFYPRREEGALLTEELLKRLRAPIHLKEADALIDIIRHIRQEISFKKAFYEEKLEGLLSVFYAELLRLLDVLSPSAQKNIQAGGGFYEDTPEDFYMEMMDEFFTHPSPDGSTLSELSSRLYLSVSQTQRLIKRYYGVSFREKLIQSKIIKSMRLIAATDEPLDEIAQRVGYDSYNAFFSAFTAFTGKTPSAYRKERRP